MNNIIKILVASAAFLAATFASSFNATAQNLPEGVYLENDHIAYAKHATLQPDGTYIIDLETFVTGGVTVDMKPADIVLVLDVSGSMAESITSYAYDEANVNGLYGMYSDNNDPTDYFYKHTDGKYYPVYIGWARRGYGYNYYYFLFFIVNGTRLYINSDGHVVETQPTNIGYEYTNLLNSNVQLYTQREISSTTKLAALKSAVKTFIGVIKDNDDKLKEKGFTEGNRISIVKFGGVDMYTNNGRHQTVGYYNNNADAYEHVGDGDHTATRDGIEGDINYNEVVRGLTDVSTGQSDLESAVDGLIAGGATMANSGMHLASNIISHIPSTRESNKTVVFFTDGEPNTSTGFMNSVANGAISNSKSIKDAGASVFSVGVFSSAPEEGDDVYNYLNFVSSNYPSAENMDYDGDAESSDFYKDASGGAADLDAIFEAIAHQSGGNAEVTESSAVTVDVVSASFSVPTGGSDDVEVKVAPCTGITSIEYPTGVTKQYLTFGAEKSPEEYGLPHISADINESTNTVSTTGFDFADNQCGFDEKQNKYIGYKQIIRFTITVNDEAVGGPNVATNAPESGIYVDTDGDGKPDKNLAPFNRPTVKIPVNIWIQKQGLLDDDSAVFTLSRSPFVANFDPKTAKWENFTKVIVNEQNMVEVEVDGEIVKVVKISGLDPDYYYRIKEDAWGWGYTYQDGGINYTVGDNIKNPILFVNTPDPDTPKHAEAVVRNKFEERTTTISASGN